MVSWWRLSGEKQIYLWQFTGLWIKLNYRGNARKSSVPGQESAISSDSGSLIQWAILVHQPWAQPRAREAAKGRETCKRPGPWSRHERHCYTGQGVYRGGLLYPGEIRNKQPQNQDLVCWSFSKELPPSLLTPTVSEHTEKWMQVSHRDQSISLLTSKAGSEHVPSMWGHNQAPIFPTQDRMQVFPEARGTACPLLEPQGGKNMPCLQTWGWQKTQRGLSQQCRLLSFN